MIETQSTTIPSPALSSIQNFAWIEDFVAEVLPNRKYVAADWARGRLTAKVIDETSPSIRVNLGLEQFVELELRRILDEMWIGPQNVDRKILNCTLRLI